MRAQMSMPVKMSPSNSTGDLDAVVWQVRQSAAIQTPMN